MNSLSRMTARVSALRAASGLGKRSMAASCSLSFEQRAHGRGATPPHPIQETLLGDGIRGIRHSGDSGRFRRYCGSGAAEIAAQIETQALGKSSDWIHAAVVAWCSLHGGRTS